MSSSVSLTLFERVMKRLFLYLLVALSTLVTSCSIFSSDDTTDYEGVYNGIVVYSNVAITNNLAMDGVNVAMRLAILLSEMEAVGLEFEGDEEPDWTLIGEFKYGSLYYNKKSFLMGNTSDVSISKDGNKYYVEYGANGLHTAGSYDTNYRIGTYCIDTAGNSDLLNSSSSSRWSVSIVDDEMTCAATKNDLDYMFVCSNKLGVELWSTGYGEFSYSVTDSVAQYFEVDYDDDDDDEYIGDWWCEGTITIPSFSSLTVEETFNSEFNLTIDGGGLAITQDTYSYVTLSPIIYNFLSCANKKFGGVEFIESLTSSTHDVTITTASTGVQTYNYNGYTYEFDQEFYDYYYYSSFQDDEDELEEEYWDYLEDLED